VKLLDRIDDWMNPIAVKELRQAVRGKFVAIAVLLALIVQLIAVFIITMSNSLTVSPTSQPAGPAAFSTLFTVLFTISIFLIPAYSGIRMAAERSDTSTDLLFITTIRPRTIIIGKLMAVVGLLVLLFSASLPFLVFSYVLRGIDMFAIVLLLALALIAVVNQSILALFIGSVPASRPFKILLAVGFFLGTFLIYRPMLEVTMEVLRMGVDLGILVATPFWSALGTFVGVLIALDAVVVVLTTAAISPPVANRAFPVRSMISVMWALAFIGAMWATFSTKLDLLLSVWAVLFLVFVSLVLLSAIGERETWAPRILRTIPRSPLLRAAAFLFYSGSGGGILWALLFFAGTVVLYYAGAHAAPLLYAERVPLVTRYLADGVFCIVGYALTAALLRRKLLPRIPARTTWAVALGLFLIGAIAPMVIGLAMDAETNRFGLYANVATMLNPFPMTMRSAKAAGVRTLVLALWALAVMLMNGAWIVAQARRFRPLPLQEAVES